MQTETTKVPASGPRFRFGRQPLDALFAPRTVAVIGAAEDPGSLGRLVLWNLISNPFGGTVYPVSSSRTSVLGIRAYRSVRDLPEPVDLAVLCTPAGLTPPVVGECAESGVRAAVIVTTGFRETGPDGLALEERVLAEARRGSMRVVGPNSLGVMSPVNGLNATSASGMARCGTVAFISQSGALSAAVLDWSHKMNVGFSHFVSVGSMLDVGWGDLIDYMGDDARTRSIVIYMESIGDARSFLSAAREVAFTKPIIVLKAGRSSAAARAVASHTGALTGSDEVLDAAFRRSGVLRVGTISELFDIAEVLGKQPRPRGPRLAIVTNAGGPGVLATDSLLANGGELASLSVQTVAALDAALPSHWSRGNPIDLQDDATPEQYATAFEAATADAHSDGVLVILTPQSAADPTRTAEVLRARLPNAGKPVLASWMGGVDVSAGDAVLKNAGIPSFPYPDTAARVFTLMWRHSYVLRGLHETPSLAPDVEGVAASRQQAGVVIGAARAAARRLLTEVESKQVLGAYGIPVVETRVAASSDEAVQAARQIGFPVVVKLLSGTITHKTEVGGVQLNLQDESDVRGAWALIKASVAEMAGEGHFSGVTVQPMVPLDGFELIVGSTFDPEFGPVVLFGSGGHLVEVHADRALALPPLNTTLARRMMEQTRIFKAFAGVPGRRAVALPALEQLLVRFSQLVVEQPWIREIDINPLLASGDRLVALDARVVLQPHDADEASLPRPAIRPYPTQYVNDSVLRNGARVVIRPIRPEDEPLMVKFHERLSDRSVYFRYFHMLKLNQRVAHERLTRICFIDYDREMALVAEHRDPATAERAILGVGRMTKVHGVNEAEFAIVVADDCQRQGLGSELLRRLKDVARAEHVDRVVGDVLSENVEMVRLCEREGFESSTRADDPQVTRMTFGVSSQATPS
ncbi:MAG TPA: bifunctional acetate--CoA ligase family protein/GNAT family N-acetyltransferase [Vicinamibacterales bacterium]|jgi:acetyltransferase